MSIRYDFFGKGSGNGAMAEFAERTTIETLKKFDKFTKEAGFPAFWFTEQRTKTFLTQAFSDVCNDIVMQEPPASRKGSQNHDKIENGKVDYWCKYKEGIYFIEVKSIWQEYHKDKPGMTRVFSEHDKCWKQVKHIDRATIDDWKVTKKIALTIVPFWTNTKERERANSEWKERIFDIKKIDDMFDYIKEQDKRADHITAIFLKRLNSMYHGDHDWYDNKQQDYHYIAFLWSWENC